MYTVVRVSFKIQGKKKTARALTCVDQLALDLDSELGALRKTGHESDELFEQEEAVVHADAVKVLDRIDVAVFAHSACWLAHARTDSEDARREVREADGRAIAEDLLEVIDAVREDAK